LVIVRAGLLVVGICAIGAGCFSPSYGNGQFQCHGGDAPCPPGYHCATDGTCWQDGQDPILDLSRRDLAVLDLSTATPDASPPDLALAVYPPATVWTSCGGGSGVGSVSGAQLNLSIGGAVVVGDSAAASGAGVTFSYFSDDIY
jgi:hypothetical protein